MAQISRKNAAALLIPDIGTLEVSADDGRRVCKVLKSDRDALSEGDRVVCYGPSGYFTAEVKEIHSAPRLDVQSSDVRYWAFQVVDTSHLERILSTESDLRDLVSEGAESTIGPGRIKMAYGISNDDITSILENRGLKG